MTISHLNLIRCFYVTLFCHWICQPSDAHSQDRAQVQRVVFLGDSITYDGRWAVRVESALRQLPEYREAEIVNLGLASETVSGLSEQGHAGGKFPRPSLNERLGRILEQFRPNLVIACYGMNDGIYQSLDSERQKAYQEGILRLKGSVDSIGSTIVFVTPPPFQIDHPEKDNAGYDRVLEGQSDWLMERSEKENWRVINIRPKLREQIGARKQQDSSFVFSEDGIHPGEEGHRLLADTIVNGLWQVMLFPGKPAIADGQAIKILSLRAGLLKHAWLSQIGHGRPGVPQGKPLDKAQSEVAPLLADFFGLNSTTESVWESHQRLDFVFENRKAILVRPGKIAARNPWIWRTEFFGHEPQLDLVLLDAGYHVAYIDMQNMYGSPASMKIMDAFHRHCVAVRGLNRRVVMEGFSRGGLYALNWGAMRPENCSAIYVDAPVCDFKSWPGGKGKGPGSVEDWKRLLSVYEMTEEQAMAYRENPIDKVAVFANQKIPLIAVIGDADEIVPVAENIDILEKGIKEADGQIEVIRKKGVKHHPHSLKDPSPILQFLLTNRILEE